MADPFPQQLLTNIEQSFAPKPVKTLFKLFGAPRSIVADFPNYSIDEQGAVSTSWHEHNCRNILYLDGRELTFTKISDPQSEIPGDEFSFAISSAQFSDVSIIEELTSYF